MMIAFRLAAALAGPLVLAFVLAVPSVAAPPAGPEDARTLALLEEHLNEVDTVRADFIQTSPGGVVAGGTFFLKRPGRLRFEYADPIEDFIVADGTFIFFYDAKLKRQTNSLISRTLANFLLRDEIRLTGDVTTTDIQRRPGEIRVTVIQTDEPGAGSLSLVFATEPLELRQWTVVDAQGKTTEVSLLNQRHGLDLPSDLFYYHDPEPRRTNQ